MTDFFVPLHYQSASGYLKLVFFASENSLIVWQVFIFKWYRRSGNPCGKWKKFRKLSYIAKQAYMTTKVTSKSRYIASLSRNDFLKRALPLVWCLVWLVCAVIQCLRVYIRSLIKGRTKSYSIAINHFLSKSSRVQHHEEHLCRRISWSSFCHDCRGGAGSLGCW